MLLLSLFLLMVIDRGNNLNTPWFAAWLYVHWCKRGNRYFPFLSIRGIERNQKWWSRELGKIGENNSWKKVATPHQLSRSLEKELARYDPKFRNKFSLDSVCAHRSNSWIRKRDAEGEVESRGLFRTGKIFFRRQLLTFEYQFQLLLVHCIYSAVYAYSQIYWRKIRSLLLDRCSVRAIRLIPPHSRVMLWLSHWTRNFLLRHIAEDVISFFSVPRFSSFSSFSFSFLFTWCCTGICTLCLHIVQYSVLLCTFVHLWNIILSKQSHRVFTW